MKKLLIIAIGILFLIGSLSIAGDKKTLKQKKKITPDIQNIDITQYSRVPSASPKLFVQFDWLDDTGLLIKNEHVKIEGVPYQNIYNHVINASDVGKTLQDLEDRLIWDELGNLYSFEIQ